VNGIPKGMRIKGGSTVLIPKSAGKTSDISVNLAENASLSLEKPPPPPAPKKGSKQSKTPAKATPKDATKRKSPSTAPAKSAKNTLSKPSAATTNSGKVAVKN